MVAVTLGVARVRDAASPDAAQAAPRKGLWTRFIEALIELRLRQAQREIRMHTRLLPYSFDDAGDRLVKSKPGDMPFGGW